MTVYYWKNEPEDYVEIPIKNVKTINFFHNTVILEKSNGTEIEIEISSISFIEEDKNE